MEAILGWVAPAIGLVLANVMFFSPYKVRTWPSWSYWMIKLRWACELAGCAS